MRRSAGRRLRDHFGVVGGVHLIQRRPTSDGGDAEPDGLVARPDADADAGGDARPSFDAHVAVDGALIDDSFEVGVTCDAWVLGNGGTAFPVAGGHSGLRSCRLCANGSGGFMLKAVMTDGGGTLQAVAFVRAPEQDAAVSIALLVRAYFPDGGTSGIANGGGAIPAQYDVVQAVISSASAGTTTVTVALSLEDKVGCVLVDDVSLVQE